MARGRKKPNEYMSNGFSERLKMYIGDREMAHFGEKIGTSGEMVNRYLNGAIPSGDILYKIAKAIGRSMEWLLTGTDVEGSPENWEPEIIEACKKLKFVYDAGPRYKKALHENLVTFVDAIKATEEKDLADAKAAESERRLEEARKEIEELKRDHEARIKALETPHAPPEAGAVLVFPPKTS